MDVSLSFREASMDVPVSGAYGCETARVVLRASAAHSRLALRNLKFSTEACGAGQYHNKSSANPAQWPGERMRPSCSLSLESKL